MQKEIWDYKCFKDHRNKVVIIDWIKKDLSKKAWQYAKRSMENLAQRPISDWHKPNPASKINISYHIYVIRYKDENRTQWRIYGFHNQQKYVFVMTNYGTERDGKYDPTISDSTKQAESCMDLCSKYWERHVCSCITRLQTGNSLSIANECFEGTNRLA